MLPPTPRIYLTALLCLVAAIQCHAAGLVEVIAKSQLSIGAVGTYSEVDNPRFGFCGTGFVVGDGNVLVTNAHVLPDAGTSDNKSTLTIQFRSVAGKTELRPAVIATLDKSKDLALLRF